MKVVCGIYKIENTVNGKCYIGKSVDIYKRWNEHIRALDSNKHYNVHFQRAWTKYGKSQFTFDILDVCSREELSDKEQYYISKFDAFNNGYNQTLGGEGMLGHIQSQETKNKRSKAFSGENNPMYGRKGELSPTYGIKKTDEQIQRMLDSRWTEEKRLKQSGLVAGENNPMYGKSGSLNPESKAVMCLNTNDTFETVREAAKWCGLKAAPMIGQVCLGKRKHAGKHPQTGEKLQWAYIDIT